MATCTSKHQMIHEQSRERVLQLDSSQSSEHGRHICALCAYERGVKDVLDHLAGEDLAHANLATRLAFQLLGPAGEQAYESRYRMLIFAHMDLFERNGEPQYMNDLVAHLQNYTPIGNQDEAAKRLAEMDPPPPPELCNPNTLREGSES